MERQLKVWEGEFGKDYTNRNIVNWQVRLSAFKRILDGISINNVLEVGCNRGSNLIALAEILGESDLVGIEINRYALEIARLSSTKVGFLYGHAYDLPFKDGFFDLVFTSGVLIHIPPDSLQVALNEIYRVSKRYILAIEYFAEEETIIPYHGYNDLLWKRPFLKHYQTLFPDLLLVRDGFLSSEEGFDRTTYWLLEKTSTHS